MRYCGLNIKTFAILLEKDAPKAALSRDQVKGQQTSKGDSGWKKRG
jgi:hypothetical protein